MVSVLPGDRRGCLKREGESAFNQDEYEDAMMRFDDLGVKLSVVQAVLSERRYLS